ncbi:N-6 DNA methylase [Holdemanella biformis]|uniref:site-specific DNA-methyltransferase (adenine-specific) n=1 Tax=Holdemanella biformis TaxID=1735 RepID=A0A412IYW3_9FIRM|nr:N-6 DNA methylase [Holdemanella biformis]RGS45277.1 restriction endonuclease subunit M [Holdemanella biformis]
MLGAIIGDIVGSRFEWHNHRSKNFKFLTYKCFPTDDSIMSLAIAQAILTSKDDYSDLSKNAVECMQSVGRNYPDCGYGGSFYDWIFSEDPKPYNSYGNGAAMRVSAAGFAANSIEEAKKLSKSVTEVSHNHPEGLKGAEVIAVAIYMAKTGSNIFEIRDYVNKNYYPMNFTLDEIRDSYQFNETCQGTVPQALEAFFESTGFEDAIRNAISIGGDSDTVAAICGGVAEAYYGVPTDIRKHALTFLDQNLMKLLTSFENKYPPVMEKKHDDVSVSIKRSENKKVKIGGRESMIQSAVEIADQELKDSIAENEKITSQKLFTHLFEACNILRGPINQDEFKDYVTPILFFKRISDVYDEETQEALELSGGDEEFASFDENHSFVIPEGCHWKDLRNASQDVGKIIVKAMNGIERANPETLSGVFSSFDDVTWTDKTKLTDERLKDLIEHMSKLKVGNKNYSADVMGDAYEYLIKKFADLSKKNAGEYYTPRTIVKLMVMLMDPKPGDTVYDPACGTGGMLIEAIRHIGDKQMTYGRIYGQENNLSTSAIARMNLFLHGASDFKVAQGDTLRTPKFIEHGQLQKFNCILANPPFGQEKWGADSFESDKYGRNIWGCPSDSNADFAWLQHMIKSMEPMDGKVAVVLPQGVLFHSGKEGDIREQLIKSDLIEAVVTLAGGIFYGTGVSACILLLNNYKRPEHKGKVCLINATNIYTPKRAQNVMEEKDISEVFKLYQDYKDVIEKCKIVSIADIDAKGNTLAVNTYIEKKKQVVVAPEIVRAQYFEALKNVKEAENKMKKLLIQGGYVDEQ